MHVGPFMCTCSGSTTQLEFSDATLDHTNLIRASKLKRIKTRRPSFPTQSLPQKPEAHRTPYIIHRADQGMKVDQCFTWGVYNVEPAIFTNMFMRSVFEVGEYRYVLSEDIRAY